jgi:SsrA-binding protein
MGQTAGRGKKARGSPYGVFVFSGFPLLPLAAGPPNPIRTVAQRLKKCYKKYMSGEKTLCLNKKARHDYSIEETYETGIALQGTEVKSLRLGKGNLKDSHVQIENEEAFLYNTHISPYPYGHQFNHDPERVRKLLLHRREIKRLMGKVQQRGYTLIPLKFYLKNGKVKVEIGLAKGKTLYDKREDLKKRSADREMEKALKDRR